MDLCEILSLLKNDVIKRDLTESEEAIKNQAVVRKIYQKLARKQKDGATMPATEPPPVPPIPLSEQPIAPKIETQAEIN